MWHLIHDWRFTCVSDDKLTVVHVHRTYGLRQSAFGISVRLTEFRDYLWELSRGWLREKCVTAALATHSVTLRASQPSPGCVCVCVCVHVCVSECVRVCQ